MTASTIDLTNDYKPNPAKHAGLCEGRPFSALPPVSAGRLCSVAHTRYRAMSAHAKAAGVPDTPTTASKNHYTAIIASGEIDGAGPRFARRQRPDRGT
jgi:hypothetical protein